MIKLDKTDKHIIKLLQENSKLTTKEIAYRIGLSNTAVFERIKKLEKSKVIKSYTIILDESIIEKNFVVFCFVKLIQHTKDLVLNFENKISELSEVMTCFHVSGDYDYILKINVKDMNEYREFMVSKLTNIKGIGSTHSSFVITNVKNQHVFELLDES